MGEILIWLAVLTTGIALGLLAGCAAIGWLSLGMMRLMTRRIEELLHVYAGDDQAEEPPPKRRCL